MEMGDEAAAVSTSVLWLARYGTKNGLQRCVMCTTVSYSKKVAARITLFEQTIGDAKKILPRRDVLCGRGTVALAAPFGPGCGAGHSSAAFAQPPVSRAHERTEEKPPRPLSRSDEGAGKDLTSFMVLKV